MRRAYLFACSVLLGMASAPASAGDWQAIPVGRVTDQKPGYGGLSGVVVDHATGDVYVCVSDLGLFHSKDLGKTWARLDGAPPKGRTEWPGCLLIDPTGKSKRTVLARVYGGPIAVGDLDSGKWHDLGDKSGHIDWCAVDWTDPEMGFILALKHESGGTLIVSHDGGKSFGEIGKGYGPAWVFDRDTAVVVEARTKDRPKPGLVRTADGGKTFQACGNFHEFGATALPKWRDGALYWLTNDGLIRTTDAGKTWELEGAVKDARYGPIFGKDAKQMFVLTGAGVVESADGGTTWAKPIAPPKDFKGISSLSWIDYDPVHDVLYMMKMGGDLYRMERGKK